jgi:hypothetical protein
VRVRELRHSGAGSESVRKGLRKNCEEEGGQRGSQGSSPLDRHLCVSQKRAAVRK